MLSEEGIKNVLERYGYTDIVFERGYVSGDYYVHIPGAWFKYRSAQSYLKAAVTLLTHGKYKESNSGE